MKFTELEQMSEKHTSIYDFKSKEIISIIKNNLPKDFETLGVVSYQKPGIKNCPKERIMALNLDKDYEKELKMKLRNDGLKFRIIKGFYGGFGEKTFMIKNISFEDVQKIAKDREQESFLFGTKKDGEFKLGLYLSKGYPENANKEDEPKPYIFRGDALSIDVTKATHSDFSSKVKGKSFSADFEYFHDNSSKEALFERIYKECGCCANGSSGISACAPQHMVKVVDAKGYTLSDTVKSKRFEGNIVDDMDGTAGKIIYAKDKKFTGLDESIHWEDSDEFDKKHWKLYDIEDVIKDEDETVDPPENDDDWEEYMTDSDDKSCVSDYIKEAF